VNISNINRYNGDMLDNRFDRPDTSFFLHQHGAHHVHSIYHGGTFAVRAPFSKGMTFQGSYTFGKVLTDAEAKQGTTVITSEQSKSRSLTGEFDVHQRGPRSPAFGSFHF